MTNSPFESVKLDHPATRQHLDHLRQPALPMKNPSKFQKTYRETTEKKKQDKKKDDRIPLHQFFSNAEEMHKKEGIQKMMLENENKVQAQLKAFASHSAKEKFFTEKEHKQEHIEQSNVQMHFANQQITSVQNGTEIQHAAALSPIQLDPAALDLFEKMAGVMTTMTLSGINQTTITLNASSYASSPFYGAQIIISEYSTAPKAFNIQLIASAEAATVLHRNLKDLMNIFESGNYNFKINRLETHLFSSETAFERKGPISADEEKNS